MKMIQRTALVLITLLASSAFAQTGYECSSGGLVRRVEIVYSGDGRVPCEVQYVKETEAPGSRETLWDARNESGYCEARAEEFVNRLQSLGWSCDQVVSAGASDDSAALAPAEDQQ
jgi:hypothetical protein